MGHSVTRPQWLRRTAMAATALFAWTGLLAVPVQALAHPLPTPKREGIRSLTTAEMEKIRGSHFLALSTASGSTYPWEGSVGGTNTGNGNKTTTIPLVGWKALGGMPVSFALVHNSESGHNSELGPKWTHSFDIYLLATSGGGGGGFGGVGGGGSTTDLTVHWGDDLAYKFIQNVTGTYSAPTGIHDTLVANVG